MRELWIKINSKLNEKDIRKLIEKTSNFASAYWADSKDIEKARYYGANVIVSKDEKADILLVNKISDLNSIKKVDKKIALIVNVESKKDEEQIEQAVSIGADYILTSYSDWKIIPLENLIAKIHGKAFLFSLVSNYNEAKTALETLEIGADGVVIDFSNIKDIIEMSKKIREVKTRDYEHKKESKLILTNAQVKELKTIEIGARVCIDTCDLMVEGEGLLVGSQSSALFLVEAEVHKNPFVAPRPFRVNAGSIALYILTSKNKTSYLSELKSGEEILIVNRNGGTRKTNICRVKIEWRPLLLIEAEVRGKNVKTIVQNAETVRLVAENESKSVKDLKSGDKILVYTQEGGRHFGTLVKKEKVIER